MNNVEAVSALGDNYDVREAQFADGVGTILGALFGGILPITVSSHRLVQKSRRLEEGTRWQMVWFSWLHQS
jgi:hypothetical protein